MHIRLHIPYTLSGRGVTGGAKKGMETNIEYGFLEFCMKLHGF